MKIGGFIKFSLIDYPSKLSAVIFTQGCNFRCLYCHNPQLVYPEKFSNPIPFEYIFEFLSDRKSLLDAVVLCGGEPTLQEDLLDVILKIRSLGYLVKLDTNGSRPEILEKVLAYVDYVALDIKAPFGSGLYSYVCGTNVDENKILKSMTLLRNSKITYEFRTTFHPKYLPMKFEKEIYKLLNQNEKYTIQYART